MFRFTPMVKNILIINLVVFVLQSMMSLNLSEIFGLRVVFAEEFQIFQFLTYMWIHGGFGHLFGNMFAVLIFGPMLEQIWGPKRFLTFYLVCGIGAGILFGAVDFAEKLSLKNDMEAYVADPNPEDFKLFILDHASYSNGITYLNDFADEYYDNPNSEQLIMQSKQFVEEIFYVFSNIPMVGASGAVFGILMAFAMLFPNTTLYLYFAIPVKAKYVVFAYAMFEIYSELNRSPGDNVAHLAHLGGMLIAFIMLKYWQRNANRF
ncbi:MAG: rhomboid family intramembrane serine protease [Cyclobacteriaceae bacterium]